MRDMAQIITGERGKQDSSQLKGINERILLSQAAPTQKSHVEWNTVSNNGVITNKRLETRRNRLKTRRASYLLRNNAGETLHTIGNRTARSNQAFHLIKNSRSLELDGRNLQDRILFSMQPCCLQVKSNTNRWLFGHK